MEGLSAGRTTTWDWKHLQVRAFRETSRVLRGSADAEDAAQEALLRAWRSRGACRASGDPGAWVRCIAHREAIRLATRPERSKEVPGAGTELERPEPSHADRIHTAVDVSRALHRLSDGDREMLELRYGADLTQPAVARVLGLPEGTAKVRLHRLRRRLQTELEAD
jgi:RNA polymerase sigma-70 factor (ECF subfamily)